MIRRYLFLFSFLLVTSFCGAQTAVRVDVDLAKPTGKFTPIYSWFGYDESGYTATPNGQALLAQLHDLSPVPVYVRAHFLLARPGVILLALVQLELALEFAEGFVRHQHQGLRR